MKRKQNWLFRLWLDSRNWRYINHVIIIITLHPLLIHSVTQFLPSPSLPSVPESHALLSWGHQRVDVAGHYVLAIFFLYFLFEQLPNTTKVHEMQLVLHNGNTARIDLATSWEYDKRPTVENIIKWSGGYCRRKMLRHRLPQLTAQLNEFADRTIDRLPTMTPTAADELHCQWAQLYWQLEPLSTTMLVHWIFCLPLRTFQHVRPKQRTNFLS